MTYTGQAGGYDQDEASACVRDNAYPLAVVALDGLTCEATGNPTVVRPMMAEDLQVLNQMRSAEVAALSNPAECPSAEETAEWTRTQLAAHGFAMEVRFESNYDDLCYRPWVYWHRQRVDLIPDGVPIGHISEGGGPPTIAPTTTAPS